MKPEVGMYVRLKGFDNLSFGKIISKVEDSCEYSIKCNDGITYNFKPEHDFKKTSFNIIDLIEVGDVLNIKYENKEYICKVVNVLGDKGVQISSNFSVSLDIVDIKSVVTKEQFEQMSYKLGDN